MRRRSPVRAVVTSLVVASLLLVGPGTAPALAAAQADAAAYVDARETVDRFTASMRELREELDPVAYDLSALSFEIAFDDAPTIVERVHEDVAFEPYRGTLRGAAGTYASGAGNALDQALLVAVLLMDAGYEAEVRHAVLDDAAARDVLAQVRGVEATPAATMAVDPGRALPGLTEDALEAYRADAERTTADLLGDAEGAATTLLDLVDLAPDDPAALLDVAREYYWVAYRLASSDPWQDAHPIFGETPAGLEGLEAEETFAGTIPTNLQHRLRVQAFVERKLGDELEVVPVSAPWERPTSNAYGVARTFSFAPDGVEDVDDPNDVEAVADATQFFYPLHDGSPADGAMAFDIRGNVVPPEAASSDMAGVFGEVNRGFNEAGGLLGALGTDEEPEDPQALTAVWLEFTLVRPGGEEVTHRRMALDRIGSEARAAGDPTLLPQADAVSAVGQLAGAHTFMLDTGTYGDAYVLDRSFAAFEAVSDYLHEVLAAMEAGRRPPEYGGEAAATEAPLGPLHLYQAFGAMPQGEDVRSFRHAPGLVVMSQNLAGLAQVDVVANPRTSLRVGPDGPRPAPEVTLRAGAWETRTEILPLQSEGNGVSPSYRALARDLVVVDDAATLAELAVPHESALAMREDLDRGYVVVAPADGIGGEPMAGWWRVDPRTGETLGRGGDGRGNAFLEYLTTFEVSVALSAGFTVYGVHGCTKIEDPTVAGCCIVQNVALAATGGALGAGAQLAFNSAEKLGRALMIFGALDVGFNVGGTFVPTFCPVARGPSRPASVA